MRSLIVNKNEAGQRLDKLLSKYMNLAGKSFLYKMMRKKNITLNGKKCDGSEKVAEGDEIRLFLADETIDKFSEVRVQKTAPKKLDIIYEDDNILLINKPAGMLSQKAKDTDESLVEYIITYLMNSGALTVSQLKTFKPSVCNRLDRNTTGLVVAGKSLAGLQLMSEVLKNRTAHKYYQCIVAGKMTEKKRITGFLKKDEKTNQVSIYKTQVPDSLPITTEYQPMEWNDSYTRLQVTLITGRTHQIRAHLASIGHPILGDYKYGNEQINDRVKREHKVKSQMLHSWRLVLPDLKEPLSYLSGKEFTAPVPSVFQKVME